MSMAYDPNSLGGFTPSGEALGAQALLRRKQKTAGGGMDQSGFGDPMGFFFNKLLQQLQNPPTTPGGTTIPNGPGVYPMTKAGSGVPQNIGFNTGSPLKALDYRTAYNSMSQTWRDKYKYGTDIQGARGGIAGTPSQIDWSQLHNAPTGELAATPDYSQLFDMANQAFGGAAPSGEFGGLLQSLQKDIGAGQYAAGTFESQAGAAAGGAAGAAMMAKLQAAVAPQLVQGAGVKQGYNYTVNLGNQPISYFGLRSGAQENQTVFQRMADQAQTNPNTAQLKTNTNVGGYSYAR
jgi:hypothetical protein